MLDEDLGVGHRRQLASAQPAASCVIRSERRVTLRCDGELCIPFTADLRHRLGAAMDVAPTLVVVDFAAVSFFDMSAIGVLVAARSALRSTGGELVIQGSSAFARRVLGIIGLADLEPAASSRRGTPVAAHLAELVESWQAECTTPSFGSNVVAFEEPGAVMSAVVAAVDDTSSTVATVSVEEVGSALARVEGSRSLAVTQLLALSLVVRRWLASNPSEGPGHDLERAANVDRVIGVVVGATLDEIEGASLLDPLTGLLNRRALDRDLTPFLAAARRHDQCLSVVMIDVNGLKATNDELGHAAGDDTLRGVASSLANTLRAGDNAYRIGGDEFVLVLPDLCPEDVDSVMRRTVVGARGAFTWGCAWIDGEDDPAPDAELATHLLAQADQRMLDFRSRLVVEGDATVSRSTTTRGAEPSIELAGHLKSGGRTGVAIEQAKGMVAQHFGLTIDDASRALRSFAESRQQGLLVTALAVSTRRIDVSALADDLPSTPADASVPS